MKILKILNSESVKIQMKNDSHILLLEVGAEGGSLKLVLELTSAGIFSYRVFENSCENLMFSDDVVVRKTNDLAENSFQNQHSLVIDWNGALGLLDAHRWPWPHLYPIFVHPCVRSNLLMALKDRFSKYPKIQFKDWEHRKVN